MQRFIAITLSVSFFLWLLPLGIFIKPSQEKTICGGLRAICLCSHSQFKNTSKLLDSIQIKSNSGSHKEEGSAGNHYFLNRTSLIKKISSVFNLTVNPVFAYRNPSIQSIEHVPKV